MSKKFFINNLDSDFGQALLQELVKQPTEEPVHMGTTKSLVNSKPNGIKKILKRQKPKLFRKKMIQECEVYVYSLNQTQITDIEFGIESMAKPFEDNKVFVLVSDIMVWSDSGRKVKKEQKKPEGEGGEPQPQPQKKEQQPKDEDQKDQSKSEHKDEESQKEQKPIQYTFFQDIDYLDRKPLQKYSYIKEIQDKVLAIKRENVKVFIVCPGLIYGCGEDNLYPLFKAAWLQQPKNLPYIGDGLNLVPAIHMKDLVKLVVRVAENPPQSPPYLLAFDLNQDRTQKNLIQSISTGVGSGLIGSVKNSELFESPQRFLINIDIKPSKFFVGTPQQPVQLQWTSKQGLGKNVKKVLDQFCKKHELRPIKLVLFQSDEKWRPNSKIDYIHKIFSGYYRIPLLTIKDILSAARERGDEDLRKDLNEEWTAINQYIFKGEVRKLDETMKVFYRALKWRLSQNDCLNRGFILFNFPVFRQEVEYIFLKLSSKKLKRKKKAQPKQIKSVKDVDEGDEAKEGQKAEEQAKQEEPQVEQEEQQEGEGPKYQLFYPQSVITVKQAGKQNESEVIEFFMSKGIQELIYDTTGAKQNEIFQSLRNYIERNGRPNNYLVDEKQLVQRHIDFVVQQNDKSLSNRQAEVKKKKEQIKSIEDQRNKIRDEITEIVRTEGQEQIKKMPFRNYLMEFVVPTLNQGLLEVSNIIPNDPVDLLAEYLYQKSYDF